MKSPSTFQMMIFSFLFILSLINFGLAKSILLFTLNKIHLFIYFLLTCLFALGMFAGWPNSIPFGSQFSRFCVFWFVSQIIVLPFWLTLFLGKITLQNLFHLSIARYLQTTAAAFLLAAISLSCYGAFHESLDVKTAKYDIHLKNLGGKADGLKVAQITDLHLGIYFSLHDLEVILQKISTEKPDVLLITGDLVDDTTLLQPMSKILDSFSAYFPYGIYYCWGNHEYFRGYAAVEQALAQSKINVLKNKNALLINDDIPLYLLGIDYSFNRAGNAKTEYDTMLNKAMQDVPEYSTKILLAHHSIAIDNAFEKRIDLTLTGHTHGTQVGFNGKPLYNAFKYTRGMFKNGDTHAYVSTGVSGWFPFRLGCPPEIVIFTLKKL